MNTPADLNALRTHYETRKAWQQVHFTPTAIYTATFATPEGEQQIRYRAERWSLVQQFAADLGWTLIRTE